MHDAGAGSVSTMELRRAGRSGLLVSSVGLGTMTWGRDTDEHEAAEQLSLFLDAGGTLVVRRVLARVVSGPDRGQERLLEAGTIMCGSHPEADLVLSDLLMPRMTGMELLARAGEDFLRDLSQIRLVGVAAGGERRQLGARRAEGQHHRGTARAGGSSVCPKAGG